MTPISCRPQGGNTRRDLLVFEFFYDEGRVVSAEAEGVVHGNPDCLVPRDEWRVIQIALWVGIFEINRRWNLAVAHR